MTKSRLMKFMLPFALAMANSVDGSFDLDNHEKKEKQEKQKKKEIYNKRWIR